MKKLQNHEDDVPGTPRKRLTAFKALFCLAMAGVLITPIGCGSSTSTESGSVGEAADAVAETPRGLRVKHAGATPGYVLFAPLLSGTTYLIDEDGQVVHSWESDYAPSGSVYFQENGNLIRTAREPVVETFKGGGQGGRIQEFTWDEELVWEFVHASADHLLHHDIEPLPNGNILAISWEKKTVEQARQAGRRPDLLPEAGLWPDMILEIEPIRPEGGRVVWEWHMWDHLIQDHDPEAENYGDPAAQPWRINVNGDGKLQEIDPAELERLKALGYVPDDADAEDLNSDLLHTNAVAYNAELDQIVVSTPRFKAWQNQEAEFKRNLGHRPQHNDSTSRWLQRWPRRPGRGSALSLGQPENLWPGRRDRPETFRSARCPLGPRWTPGGGASDSFQQRPRRSRGEVLGGF